MRVLGFDRSELSLYEGVVEVMVPVDQLVAADKDSSTISIPLTINLQACDDTTCLAPESIELKVSTANPGPWNPALALSQ